MYYKKLKINGVEYPLAVNISGVGAPTIDTQASVGMLYMDETNGEVWKLTPEGWVSTAVEIAQGIGKSLTAVMSQKAVTDELGVLKNRVKYIEGATLSTIIDDTTAYKKSVPSNVAPYAAIEKIGGMSYHRDTNLMPYPYLNSQGTDRGQGVLSMSGSSESKTITYGDDRLYPAGTYVFEVGTQSKSEVEGLSVEFSHYSGSQPTITKVTNYKYLITSTSDFSISRFIVTLGYQTEPTLYPMFYPENNPITWCSRGLGEIHHAKPTAIVSKGANLWKPDVTEILTTSYSANDNVRDFKEDVWYQGLTANNWWLSGNVTDVSVSNNKVSFYVTASGYGMVRAFKCKPNTAYTFSFDYEGDFPSGCCIGFYDASGHWLDYDWDAKDIVTPNNCYWLTVNLASNDAPSNCTFSNIQLTESDVEIPYTPYVGTLDTFKIPEEVTQALYGANSGCYDYIEYTEDSKVLMNKRVGCADLGTLDWFYDDYSEVFTAPLVLAKMDTLNLLCGMYATSEYSSATLSPDMSIYGRSQDGLGNIGVKNSNYTNAAEFKSAMSGVKVYYELATPEVIDITDLMPIDNFLKVQSGGSIEAVSDYGYDVPSTIAYITKV